MPPLTHHPHKQVSGGMDLRQTVEQLLKQVYKHFLLMVNNNVYEYMKHV